VWWTRTLPTSDLASFIPSRFFWGAKPDPISYADILLQGGIRRVDIATVTFNKNQLSIMAEIIVPGSTERMLQVLADESGKEIFGQFNATNATIQTTKVRFVAYFPFESAERMLGSTIRVCQTYELIMHELIDSDMETICSTLVEFLTVFLIKPMENRFTPLIVQHHGGKSGYMSITAAIGYLREHVIYRDLSGLRHFTATAATIDHALLDVYRGFRYMVANSRVDRKDRAYYPVSDHLPPSVHKMLGEAILDQLLLSVTQKKTRTSQSFTKSGQRSHGESPSVGYSSRWWMYHAQW
jgi:hypothetical protein